MIFEIENKPPKEIKDFSLIKKSLESLKSYGPSSYAILTNEKGDYVQVAGGRVTCMVEHKTQNKSVRAYLEKPKVNFDKPHQLTFGAGSLLLEPDEFLFIDDVISIFLSFFQSRDFPEHIFWRKK